MNIIIKKKIVSGTEKKKIVGEEAWTHERLILSSTPYSLEHIRSGFRVPQL